MSLCQSTGTATTTRYWDCCKTTCAWSANAGSVTGPVETCAAGGATVVDANTQSGCAGGSAYVCNTQQPFVQDGQAYAFAAANVNGLATSSLCCACYTLTFNAAPVQGQKLTVQVINTGSDLNSNQFDLQIPGGGFGMFTEGCPKEWPAYTSSAWGAQYGGVANRTQCNNLPSACVPRLPDYRQEQAQNLFHQGSAATAPRKAIRVARERYFDAVRCQNLAGTNSPNFKQGSAATPSRKAIRVARNRYFEAVQGLYLAGTNSLNFKVRSQASGLPSGTSTEFVPARWPDYRQEQSQNLFQQDSEATAPRKAIRVARNHYFIAVQGLYLAETNSLNFRVRS
ncbi:uncharacterized protein LOC113213214 [Frankliniella occidentalis]|uniref:Cellulase n=1 Tax=Frankliniella occidentalis TaxID=133901 RepID=A0A9C6X5Y6_FRAOC|nr:uncharacterized protein LOC113213214 [Frankliniella occidentalis]